MPKEIIIEVKKMKADRTWFGYINGIYFTRWYNETEMELWRSSTISMFDALDIEYTSYSSWE